MKLFQYDAYTSLTRIFHHDDPLVCVDVGANEGQTIQRILAEFPSAVVHSFEPSHDTFSRLQALVAGEPRAKLYQLACGSTSGTIDFYVTKNHWCSSVLAPSDLGKRFYGDWYDTQRVVKVPITTLDNWAREHNIPRVDLLKVDAQGYDLEVLKGATSLLAAGVRAINCECQFAPEYQGCASFSQIDTFLVEHGYALHQLHEVHERGNEQQTTYGDGLWLRTDILQQLRIRKDLPDLSPIGRVHRALEEAKDAGCTTAALYGSGRHTRALADHLHNLPLPIRAILDDNTDTHGLSIAGIEVISPSHAHARNIDAVILSSDAHEHLLWQRSEPLRARGIRVIPLYNKSLATAPDTNVPYSSAPHSQKTKSRKEHVRA